MMNEAIALTPAFNPTPLKILRRIEPFLPIHLQNSRYVLKTVDQVSEFQEVLSLRAKVFSEDYGISAPSLDIDPIDFQCDHLIIIDQMSEKVVGTYRLVCSKFSENFYSETEFEMKDFLSAPGIKLELGRACIAHSHRKGAVLSLLWRGVIQYAIKTNATYLFGCSSVKGESFSDAKSLYESLNAEGHLSTEWKINPLTQFQIPEFNLVQTSTTPPPLPSLFRSYLNAGSKVLGEPAFDPAFHCFDFLTVLRLTDITANYEKRYQA